MSDHTSTYINPLTDFGFKYIFGREADKDFTISFLNALNIAPKPIVDLTFVDKENPGESEDDRALIYDLHCELEDKTKIIVEMQHTKKHGEDGSNTTDIQERPGFQETGGGGAIRRPQRRGQAGVQQIPEGIQGRVCHL